MSLYDLLAAAGTGFVNGVKQAPSPDTEDDPNAIVVHSKPPPPKTPISAYDNTPEVAALRTIQNNSATIPSPRSIYAGHGTLSNVLGMLGDAFLVQAGKDPQYMQGLQRQREADALAGFQNNPEIAASRLAATGMPGSLENATKLYDTAQVQKLREAEQANLNAYRGSQVQNREDTLHDRALQQSEPFIGGMLQAGAQAESAGQTGAYDKAYQRAKAYAAARHLDIDGDFGAPSKFEDYQAGYGQTARQITQGNISQGSVDERKTAAGIRDATTRRGQDMQFGKPTAATELTRIRGILNNGGTLNQGDQQTWNEYTTGKQKARVKLPGLDVGDTTAPKPTASDLAYVKSHPESRAAFQKHFGIAP